MRKFLGIFLIVAATLPGCILPPVSSTGGGNVPALGSDGVASEAQPSTLPVRIAAGLTWLWASYSALKTQGVDVSTLRVAISEMQDVVTKGDLSAALSLYGKARAIVTAVAAGAGS